MLTAHTIYFWDQPLARFAEIRRVLKPDGRFCIAFGDRSFMKDLPFVPFGFALYDSAEVGAMLTASGFQVLSDQQHHESGPGNADAHVDKLMNLVLCRAK